MAKRKGKSRHRPKDWERWHREGHTTSDNAETHRRLTQRRIRLPGQEQDAAIYSAVQSATDVPGSQVIGIVVQLYPGGAIVRTADYPGLMCGLAGTFRPPPHSSALAVGDEVTVQLMPETSGQIQGGLHACDAAPNHQRQNTNQRCPSCPLPLSH